MMKKLALNLLKSADEKLRSLSGKHHNSKPDSHTGQPKSSTLPLSQPHHCQQKLIYYPPHEGEIVLQQFHDQQSSLDEQEFQTEMAERKIQHLGRKDRFRNQEGSSEHILTEDGKIVIKRRSRSEDPPGKMQLPHMNEKPNSSQPTKSHGKLRSNRHSMYSDPLSDDADCASDKENSVTDSDSADSGPKKWTKNPLHVKRAKKLDRSEKRKSAHSLENGFTVEQNPVNVDSQSRSPRSFHPSNREAYVYQEKDLQSGQKGKYQKLEEMRRKRVDMTITSDEEFTPASRISQLRQRAIQSSSLSNKDSMEDVSIPVSFIELPNTTCNIARGEKIATQFPVDKQTQSSPAQKTRKIIPSDKVCFGLDFKNVRKKEQKPEIAPKPGPSSQQHSGSIQYPSNQGAGQPSSWTRVYSRSNDGLNRIEQTNGNINAVDGHFKNSFENVEKHQILPERNSVIGCRDAGLRIQELLEGGMASYCPGQKLAHQSLSGKEVVPQCREDNNDSDSEMTSFQEIKTKQPIGVKKAIEQIEAKHKSFSDEDSLDELIESNIQYLESEIVSRRGKKPSAPRAFPLHDISGVMETDKVKGKKKTSSLENVSGSSKGVGRKKSFYQNYPSSTGSSVTQLNCTGEKSEPLKPNFPAYEHAVPLAPRKVGCPKPPVTHSPFLYRRSADFAGKEDISKSDPQINKATDSVCYDKSQQSGYVLPQQTVPMISSSNQTKNSNFPFQQNQTSSYQTQNTTGPFQQNQTSSYQTQNTTGPLQEDQSKTALLTVDTGMFSDVDYDIEVADRVKKWEKYMKKANDYQGLMTIDESDGGGIAEGRVAPVPLNVAATSPAHVPQSQFSKSAMQTPMEPKVLSKETNLHRVFKVVQDPQPTQLPMDNRYRDGPNIPVQVPSYSSIQQQWKPGVQSGETHIKPHESPRLARQNLVWKPPSAIHTPSDDSVNVSKQNLVWKPLSAIHTPSDDSVNVSKQNLLWKPSSAGTAAVSDSDLTLNTSKQFRPPYESDSGIQSGSRLSKYEDEINELKEITSERFQNLRKRFDSDSDIQQSQAQSEMPVVKPLPANILDQWESGSNTSQSVSEPRSPIKLHSPTKGKDQKIDWVNAQQPITDQPIKKMFWSPNMESSGQGLVSIERMTARTLQTIPFSEDPFWRELEEMTSGNFEDVPKPAYIQNQLELENVISLLQQHSTSAFPEQPMLTQMPPTPPIQRDKTPTLQSHHSNSTLTATPQNIQSSSSSEQSGNLKQFTTPQIRPLTLTIGGNSSAKNALDDVLEDIRNSLEKKPTSPRSRKPSDSHASSPVGPSLLTKSPGLQLHGPSLLTQAVDNYSVEPTVPRKETYSKECKERQTQQHQVLPVGHQPANAMAQSRGNLQSQSKYIDPLFTQYPYIINGNYQLDPDLLKERLLDTGLAEHSDRKRFIDRNANCNGSLNLYPQQMQNNINEYPKAPEKIIVSQKLQPKAQSYPTEKQRPLAAKKLDDTDQSIEELKQLARDVEKKLTQIKSKIIDSDEDRLDTILLALRKFAPEIDPKMPEPKVSATCSQNVNKKAKLKDALTELEQIYEGLDLESDVLMSRAERKECMLPHSRENIDYNQSSRFASGSFPQRSHSPSHYQSVVPHVGYAAPELDSNTRTDFRDITQSFDTIFQDVSHQKETKFEGKSYDPHWNIQNCATSVNDASQNLYSDATDKRDNQSIFFRNTKKKSSSYIVLSPPMTPGSSAASTESDTNRLAMKRANIYNSWDSSTQKDITHGKFEQQPPVQMRVKRGTQDNQFVYPGQKKNYSEGPNTSQKASNNEYRKSVPADFSEILKRTVETQTMESTPTVAEVREKFESDVKNVLSRNMSVSSESSVDVKLPRKRKISRGIASLMGIFSSSDEEQSRNSGLQHSHSAPDLCNMFSDKKEIDESQSELKKSAKVVRKVRTPRSVKQRHEARARHKSLQYYHVTSKDSSEQDDITSVTSPTSDDSTTQSPQSGTTKPPLYPIKKTDAKTDSKDTSVRKLSSDISISPKLSSDDATSSCVVLRNMSNDLEKFERPRSFHELLSTFETKPERLAKFQARLRKCTSVDMTETVVSKIYHSEPDLSEEPRKRSASDSEGNMTLKLEFQWKS